MTTEPLIPAGVNKSKAWIRLSQPHKDARYCPTCRCWWVSFTTLVSGQGWTLCSMCPPLVYLDDLPWEQRRIRLLGAKNDPKYIRLHPLTFHDPAPKTIH
jgi:hypothetical protein